MSKLVFDNWDRAANELEAQGKLIRIYSKKSIKKRKKMLEIVKGSIYSPELGTTIDTDNEIKDFSCSCGNLTGRFNEDEICPLCKTPVKETYNMNLDTLGCIDVSPYKVLTPVAYHMVSSVIGNIVFQKIIDKQTQLDIDGNVKERVINNNSPYENIGLEEFYKKFEEIMLFYGKRKKKMEKAEFCIRNKKRFFTSNILVLPLDLRPLYTSSKKGGISYDPINKIYTSIVTNAEIINRNHKKPSKISVLPNLFSIQMSLKDLLYTLQTQKISGKYKVIRSKILGCKTSYSSRMVIVSLTGKYFGLDHLVVSYKAFLELYYLEILNCLINGYSSNPKFKKMTSFEIVNYLDDAKFSRKIDENIYEIMEMLINKHEDGLWILINRNPTMDLGSEQLLKIVHVIKDAEQFVMKIPLTSIKEPNADFDGDILNNHKMLEKEVMLTFRKAFSPRMLCLDRTGDKLFNENFGIQKDAEVAAFCFTNSTYTKEIIEDDEIKVVI